MKLPQFIFFDTPALPGAGFVLCTDQPFYIAKVWKFYSIDKMRSFIEERNFSDWNIVHVPGYNIILTYFTNLHAHNSPPKGPVKETLQHMAAFYLKEKIEPNAFVKSSYTKFKQ